MEGEDGTSTIGCARENNNNNNMKQSIKYEICTHPGNCGIHDKLC